MAGIELRFGDDEVVEVGSGDVAAMAVGWRCRCLSGLMKRVAVSLPERSHITVGARGVRASTTTVVQ